MNHPIIPGESSEERKARLRRLRNSRSYHKRKDEINAARRASYADSPEKHREASRRYRQNNPEKIAESNRQYRKDNAESLKEYRREYALKYPEKIREQSRRGNNVRRARRASVPSEIFSDDELIARYGTDCHLCGLEIDLTAPRRTGQPGWELGLHRDHVVRISEGGPDTLDNCRPSHGLCNILKH